MTWNAGILGCGDFLRWQATALSHSEEMKVVKLFDPDQTRARRYASELGGEAVAAAEAILDDPAIDVVCIFTPPWLRRELVERAAAAGKHVLTTKPLAPTVADAEAIVDAVDGTVACGVIYRRTGMAEIETLRKLFASGEIGRLALYKQDWLHHYPSWNRWATDRTKNGGPFMDAMIHNLNIARSLVGEPAAGATFFSDTHVHRELACADTEFLKVDFESGAAAHLFITWAADLAVHSTEGNDREHIDIMYMITDAGWRVTLEHDERGGIIAASRNGENRTWPVEPLDGTHIDRFVRAARSGAALPPDLPGAREACEDVRILERAAASVPAPA